jgi:hypothetical protein
MPADLASQAMTSRSQVVVQPGPANYNAGPAIMQVGNFRSVDDCVTKGKNRQMYFMPSLGSIEPEYTLVCIPTGADQPPSGDVVWLVVVAQPAGSNYNAGPAIMHIGSFSSQPSALGSPRRRILGRKITAVF